MNFMLSCEFCHLRIVWEYTTLLVYNEHSSSVGLCNTFMISIASWKRKCVKFALSVITRENKEWYFHSLETISMYLDIVTQDHLRTRTYIFNGLLCSSPHWL